MGQLLGIGDARALSRLAESVENANGVTFVPALSGLGAPHWDDRATGTITGMTHGTMPAHLARATFEAIANQIADVFEAMQADIGAPLQTLRADGGATSNSFLMQLQADLLGRPVERAEIEEVGALGAAAMAFSALGAEPRFESGATRFDPEMPPAEAEAIRSRWREAIRRLKT
jgi:glycerol kinase